jgi:hypothetical protein
VNRDEASHQGGDLAGRRLEREMARIEDMDDGPGLSGTAMVFTVLPAPVGDWAGDRRYVLEQ